MQTCEHDAIKNVAAVSGCSIICSLYYKYHIHYRIKGKAFKNFFFSAGAFEYLNNHNDFQFSFQFSLDLLLYLDSLVRLW